MDVSQLTIFGAGLIGGSVALAAREQKLARRIVAVDVESAPQGQHPFDEWIHAADSSSLSPALATSDLVLLCVPVRVIARLLPTVLSQTPGVVSDCGSTKVTLTESVAHHAGRGRFVAGHPMAGHPEGGLKNARADLFQGRKWILCPAGSESSATKKVRKFVSALGAEIVEIDAPSHDRSVAVTSHVPQVVASALSVLADEQNAKQAAGPGFASATRVAGGAEAMWRDIFETNAEAIGNALLALGKDLENLGEQLRRGDVEGALATLEKARKLRDDS